MHHCLKNITVFWLFEVYIHYEGLVSHLGPTPLTHPLCPDPSEMAARKNKGCE